MSAEMIESSTLRIADGPPRAEQDSDTQYHNKVFRQLHREAIHHRKALRMYMAHAQRNQTLYAPIVGVRWPLLEYVRKTLPRGTEGHKRHSAKALTDFADTVYAHAVAKAITQTDSIAEQYRYDLANRVKNCGVWMGYKECPDGHRQAHVSMCDKTKYCRRCARIKAHRQAKEIALILEKLMQRPRAGYWLRMLTVTVKNTGDIEADVRRCNESFSKLWRSLYGGKHSHAAAIRFTELGAENGTAHAHVLMYAPFVSHKTISEKWEQFTGDSMVVEIHNIGGMKDGAWSVKRQAIQQAAHEVCKYATDFDKWVERYGVEKGAEKVLAIGLKLHGLHMRQTYGCFRKAVFERRMGYPIPRPPKDETVNRCGCCGKLWHKYVEVAEPRGPPTLRIVST